ncbi:hypothetical protein ABEP17_18985 [Priestia flexa]|nr:hypothetical protein [Priestia flexa]MDT2048527.1 hypothetical protein [Priestia flexa]MEC0666550.1 hypothetical protein [Priestia flexa]WEZ08579.1 hypothetical protein P5663_01085 [Priestia flexa]SIR47906.1 hypothetical protein SAMN05880580_12438 [Priestia flexa]
MKEKEVELFPGQCTGTIKVFINCLEIQEPIQLELELVFQD